MRTQLELPDDVAVELAGSQDAVLRALQEHLGCKVFLRGPAQIICRGEFLI